MLRPDSASAAVAAVFAREYDRIALPLSGAGPAEQRGFSVLMSEIRDEIADFIDNGTSGAAGAAAGTREQARHARLQAALQDADRGAARGEQESFIASIAPWAHEAAARLGVSPDLVTAHAALESGWGQHPLRGSDGSTTHNLFGLKAGGAWSGEAVRAPTTEFEDGVATSKQQDFRSYADIASAFRDYAGLLIDNPRYRPALHTGADARAFALGLVHGSYATDPSYADKLERVARQVQAMGVPNAPDAPPEASHAPLLRGR